MLVDRHTAQGLSPQAAQRAAQMEFEGVEQVKERVRDARSGSAIELGEWKQSHLEGLERAVNVDFERRVHG